MNNENPATLPSADFDFALSPAMQACKICVLGDFAVGKTSLVLRYVHNDFSHTYLTSIGVKVDLKKVTRPDRQFCKLAVWDIAGTDTPTELFLRYLRGTSGYLLVADGTRVETLDRALALREAVESQLGVVPFVGLINKSDLLGEQEIGEDRLTLLEQEKEIWLRTSAFDNTNVERAFDLLLAQIETGK